MPGLKLLETSTILSLWVVCHGHSDLGRYHPLVGPVGIPRTWLILLLKIILAGSSPGLVLPYIAYTLWGCAAGQGMVYYLSVAKGIWFRESLSTGYFLQDWFDLLDEFCLFSKYTKVMTVTYRALLQLPINVRGVICELLLNFTVDTTHRFCFYAVKSSKPSFDQLINLVI